MFLRLTLLALSASVVLAACGDDDDDAAAPIDAACGTLPPAEFPAGASCGATIERPPVGDPTAAGRHVAEGTEVTYCSNPPSSGPHYGIWAGFNDFTTTVPWPYLVHSLEHGAVLLLYKCDGECPDVVAALKAVRDRAPADPVCSGGGKRIITMPSATIPTKIAASAWGVTYKADCVDEASLDAFVRDNFGKGPEDLCVPGRSF